MSQRPKTYTNDEKEMTIWNMHRHRQILLMALSFVFCWAPFGWVYLVKLIGIRDIDSRARSDMVPLLCVKLGSAVINPLIYVFENTKVRSMMKDPLLTIFIILKLRMDFYGVWIRLIIIFQLPITDEAKDGNTAEINSRPDRVLPISTPMIRRFSV